MGYFHDPDEEFEAARRFEAVCIQAVHEWINDILRAECLDGGDDLPWIKLEGEAFQAFDRVFQRLPLRKQLLYQELAEEALFHEPTDETEFF